MEYVNFIVDLIEEETTLVKSFYLKREDGKALEQYKPGQYLLFNLAVQGKNLLRFYTISDCFNNDYYRISIKKELAPDTNIDTPNGLGSCYFHDEVQKGTIIRAKGPSGDFTINPKSDGPIVLISGGIGVTPILSMLNAISMENPSRKVFVYLAMQNKANHPFKKHIETIIDSHASFDLIVFYDNATSSDEIGKDYQVEGRISLNKIKPQLGNLTDYSYYICGPRPMMDTITQDLNNHHVIDENINTEAFGPASTSGHTPDEIANSTAAKQEERLTVEFEKSGVTLDWSSSYNSILELAEANGIQIDTGCLFGDCGTCLTEILNGEVKYNHLTAIEPKEGSCLPCSCKPTKSLQIQA